MTNWRDDLALLREAIEACVGTDADWWNRDYADAPEALARVGAELERLERERDDYRQRWLANAEGFAEQARIKEQAFAERDSLRKELAEQRTRATLTRLDDAKAIGLIFDHSREALEAAYAELERADQHHQWHHDQEGRDVEEDDERLRVLMVIAEAIEELPEPLAEDAETQVRELRAVAVGMACPDCNVNATVGQGPCDKHREDTMSYLELRADSNRCLSAQRVVHVRSPDGRLTIEDVAGKIAEVEP